MATWISPLLLSFQTKKDVHVTKRHSSSRGPSVRQDASISDLKMMSQGNWHEFSCFQAFLSKKNTHTNHREQDREL
jgi:hypothetical protein